MVRKLALFLTKWQLKLPKWYGSKDRVGFDCYFILLATLFTFASSSSSSQFIGHSIAPL